MALAEQVTSVDLHSIVSNVGNVDGDVMKMISKAVGIQVGLLAA